jgi:hypothetical protein
MKSAALVEDCAGSEYGIPIYTQNPRNGGGGGLEECWVVGGGKKPIH